MRIRRFAIITAMAALTMSATGCLVPAQSAPPPAAPAPEPVHQGVILEITTASSSGTTYQVLSAQEETSIHLHRCWSYNPGAHNDVCPLLKVGDTIAFELWSPDSSLMYKTQRIKAAVK